MVVTKLSQVRQPRGEFAHPIGLDAANSWLYTQPALRRQIEQLRDRRSARSVGVPVRQRATEASLRQRLETLRVENQRLREENASLKTELAIAYGQQRSAQRR
jgi:hypothetical protein